MTSHQALERMLAGQPRYFQQAGFDVTVVCGRGPGVERFAKAEGVRVATVGLEREISPLDDLRALLALVRLFRDERPDVVHVGTPKAGLLGSLAARLAGVPRVIYTLHGLRLETATGRRRMMLAIAERITCRAAHRIVCVSASVRDRLREFYPAAGPKARVLGEGSANGAPLALEPRRSGRRGRIRTIGFVGRLTADKGIKDLVEVFGRLHAGDCRLRLLLVGDYESGDPVGEETKARIAAHSAIRVTGFTQDPWRYYREMDLLVLPSYREGLPNAVLEAGVFSLPTAAYAATGTIDAVADGITGTLVEPGDVEGLGRAVRRLIEDPRLADKMGRAARLRVEERFRPERLWALTLGLYEEHRLRAHRPVGGSRQAAREAA